MYFIFKSFNCSTESFKGVNKKISEWLIENKYAFAYDGGKKKDWNDYLESINNF
jgi:hypothetical protein